jgi:hypothetical protein
MKKRSAILLFPVLVGGGCAYTLRSSEGTQISSAEIQELKIGQTTESDPEGSGRNFRARSEKRIRAELQVFKTV